MSEKPTNSPAVDGTDVRIDPGAIGEDTSLLLVDDDAPFLRRLARAMETRGFSVEIAESVAEGIAKTKTRPQNTP